MCHVELYVLDCKHTFIGKAPLLARFDKDTAEFMLS